MKELLVIGLLIPALLVLGCGGGDDDSSEGQVYGATAFHLKSCSDISVGIALDFDSEQAALDAATDACEDDGGTASDCRADAGSFTSCGVITWEEFLAGGPDCRVTAYNGIDALGAGSAEFTALSQCRLQVWAISCSVLSNDDGEDMSGCNQ